MRFGAIFLSFAGITIGILSHDQFLSVVSLETGCAAIT
jgi:hypothetical protein